jgi:hypothetical protein
MSVEDANPESIVNRVTPRTRQQAVDRIAEALG